MKKFFHATLATVLLVTSLVYSKPSHALVGAFAGPTVALIGLATIGGGIVTGISLSSGGSCDWGGCLGGAVIGGAIGILGLVILEGENTPTFHVLSAKEALKLGLTKSELMNFNSEIDQANAVMGMVSEEISLMENASAKDSAEVWENASTHLSPETFSAMVKVARQLSK